MGIAVPEGSSHRGGDDGAAFMAALRELDRALDENADRARRMKQRIVELEEAYKTGRPIKEIVPEEETPLIVELLTQSAETLQTYGSRVRRAEARVLHREGLTMDQIARLFGVTRQRVSALLREAAGEP
jgi:DNA-directed RNA polymerase sigma subunit (sigma70/sigma32)